MLLCLDQYNTPSLQNKVCNGKILREGFFNCILLTDSSYSCTAAAAASTSRIYLLLLPSLELELYIAADCSEPSLHIQLRHQSTISEEKKRRRKASSSFNLCYVVHRGILVTTENNKSPSSCVSPAATSTMSAGESSWAMHIANFLVATPQDREMDQQPAVSGGSFSSGFSSSFGSLDDDASFITSELMCDDEEEDESLQDTACSSAAVQKVATMENFDIKAMSTMDAKEFNMPQLAKYFEAAGSQHQVTKADQQLFNSYSNNEKAVYESNELRKKGLCLVPISMLINYLG